MKAIVKSKKKWYDEPYETNAEKQAKCKHEGKTDLTHGKGEVRNFYCPTCKTHWYKGKIWSEKEWGEYVNDIEEFPKKVFIVYKPTGKKEEVLKVWSNGEIDLKNGLIINKTEFDRDWEYFDNTDSK
jgi:ADP-heptose:LPS heptosyltransferase